MVTLASVALPKLSFGASLISTCTVISLYQIMESEGVLPLRAKAFNGKILFSDKTSVLIPDINYCDFLAIIAKLLLAPLCYGIS